MQGKITQDRLAKALNLCSHFFLKNDIKFDYYQEIISKSRKAGIVFKRALCVKILLGEFNVVEMSGFIRKDHTSVIHLRDNYVVGSSTPSYRDMLERASQKIEKNQIKELIKMHREEIKRLEKLL